MGIHLKDKSRDPRRPAWASPLIAAILFFILTGHFQACRTVPEPGEAPLLSITAVGDTYADTEWLSGADPLEGVRGLLHAEDLFIFNMEGVLLSQNPPPGTCRKFPYQSLLRSHSSIAEFLHPTGHTVASLGNNHILDCGVLGIRETENELARRGIRTVGAGENIDSACRPLTLDLNGLRVALVSYLSMRPDSFSATPDTAGAASWEHCSAESSIAELAETSDLVIVVLHLHLTQGWTDRTPSAHLDLARKALDAGADIVICHGPHVPQGILVREGGVAFLSLGNFLFRPKHTMPPQAHDSLMVRITVLPRYFKVNLLPLSLDVRGRPMIPSEKEAGWMLRRLAELSAELGTTIDIKAREGGITLPRKVRIRKAEIGNGPS